MEFYSLMSRMRKKETLTLSGFPVQTTLSVTVVPSQSLFFLTNQSALHVCMPVVGMFETYSRSERARPFTGDLQDVRSSWCVL